MVTTLELNKIYSKSKIFSGFNDNEIIELCQKNWLIRCPQIFEHSYIYSFSKVICDFVGWPKFLPIPLYHDHGIAHRNYLMKDEIENKSNYLLTWSTHRSNIKTRNKIIITMEHPYIRYRKKNFSAKKLNGTIVFLPHTAKDIKIKVDYLSFFKNINLLSKKFKPIVLCMSALNFSAKYLKFIRSFGYPVVTAGNISSDKFVDRFYKCLENFKYCCSNDTGSFLPLSYEFGLKPFIIGKKIKIYNISNLNHKINSLVPEIPLENEVRKLFHYRNLNKKKKLKDIMIKNLLALNYIPNKNYLKFIFIKEFIRLLPLYIYNIFSKLVDFLKKFFFEK